MRGPLLRQAYRLVMTPFEAMLVLPIAMLALLSRVSHRPIAVGLGPEPLVNNIYHKKALAQFGYSAETFVTGANFISSNYDLNLGHWRRNPLLWVMMPYFLFIRALFRYRALFIYFNGGPLFMTPLLRVLEPYLLSLAGIKVVVMPYGSDVQAMNRSRNLHFKHVMSQDYPAISKDYRRVERQIDRWSRHADHVISGCEWVDYTHFWHTLMSGHFSIDQERWKPAGVYAPDKTLRVLHAPNHMAIKGTEMLKAAIATLQKEGLDIELVLLRGVPNTEIQATIERVDLVADQFVIGWYAMFALEALCLGKPVLCFLREDLLELYDRTGVMARTDIPLINTPAEAIAERLRWAYHHREELVAIGQRGPDFVNKYHATEAIGAVFAQILNQLGIKPEASLG